MPHILEQFTQNLGNVVDREQSVPISEREAKEVIRLNAFRGGEQTSQSGMEHNFTVDDLEQVVESYNPEVHIAPLIRGHDEKDDGAPSSGWVKKVIRKGLDLFADVALTGFGQQILEEGDYRRVSCRFYPPNDPSNPTPGLLSLRHLALVTIPAVKGLNSFSESERSTDVTWDFIFGEQLNYSSLDKNTSLNMQKKEVEEKLKQKLSDLMLDGEEEDEDAPEPMELAEEPKEYTDQNPYPILETLGKEEKEEEEEVEEEEEEKNKNEDKELKDSLLKSYSHQRAIAPTPPQYIEPRVLESLEDEPKQDKEGKEKRKEYIYSEQYNLDGSIYSFSEEEDDETVSDDSEEVSEEDADDTDEKKENTDRKEKQVKLKIPPKKKRDIQNKTHNFSEKIIPVYKQDPLRDKHWRNFSERFYKEGYLTESIVSLEDLSTSLSTIESSLSQLSFSEGQVNPLNTIEKILDNLPQVVGLNGFDRNQDLNFKNLFKDPLVEASSDSFIYGENNIPYESKSYNLHRQAQMLSEQSGLDYYSSVQKLLTTEK